MSKNIEWLDKFAESFAKETRMAKKASKNTANSIIVNRNDVKEAKVGDTVSYAGKLYKVADLEYVDEKGEGAVLEETTSTEPYAGLENDPMGLSMGTDAGKFEGQQTPQEYSRVDPGNVYDTPVEENYEQAAEETARQIEKERSQDRSGVKEHYTNPVEETAVAPVETSVEDLVDPTDLETTDDETSEVAETLVEESTDEVVEEAAEEVVEEPADEPTEELDTVEDDESVNDPTEENALVGKRYNRILRRIMASK